jgi:HEAT repeat protein
MSTVQPLLLGLLLLAPALEGAPASESDLPRLRELLYDGKHRHHQYQAAVLLVQSASADAAAIVRDGLKQTNSPEVFSALTGALRLRQDTRFVDELLNALNSGQIEVQRAAAVTLAEVADVGIVRRLQGIVEDMRADWTVRQAAVWALGRSGRRQAVVVLLDQLSNTDERVRQGAAHALGKMTGLDYGADVARWRNWWNAHKNTTNEHWLEERLAYQTTLARRLEGDLERARAEILRLHQLLYSRLPAGDRLGYVQTLADAEDESVRGLAVNWCLELLPTADAVGQRALADLLLRFSYDGTLEVQRSAVLALGRIDDVRAFDRLRSLVQQAPATVRAAAARSLAQQVKGIGLQLQTRQHQVVTVLQKALEDPAIEVVVEAAESLGTLGIPEAGPVLTVLLRHPSQPVRRTAALALERVADAGILDGLIEALDDPAVTIRFSLVGALGHAAGDGHALNEAQRLRLLARLEGILLRDADPGVRSRAATVLGECSPPALLATLWRRVLATEDSRVQEKSWAAMMEILCRAGNWELLQEWDRVLVEAKQGPRRLQLMTEVYNRWQKREETKAALPAVRESLVQVQLEQGKWATAFPLLRELLTATASDMDQDRRLRWLLEVGYQALKEGNRPETLRAVREAQPFLAQRPSLAAEFERLEKSAKP